MMMTNFNNSKNYLTPKETADYLKVSTETIRQWAKTGQLQAETTLGGHRRFNIEEVKRFATKLQIRGDAGRSPRVLVVDDDRQFVRFVEDLLSTFSGEIKIASAFDGFEAGHKVDTFKPSIILLDLVMPNINGIEVCRYLKSNPHTQHIRILATTGFTSSINIQNFINAGAETVLEKPLNVSLLENLVMYDSALAGG
jgi:excisionase family DNA binding protein